jgi:ATP-dependent DNA helicase DinG
VNDCHLYRARREAVGADVVVVNHHLVFADLQVRESGFMALLPSAHVMVFDEAHQLVETGVQFLGIRFSSATIIECARRCAEAGLQLASGLDDWAGLAAAMEQSARDLRMSLGLHAQGIRVHWQGEVPDGVEAAEWRRDLDAVVHACRAMARALARVGDGSMELDRLAADVGEIEAAAVQFSRPSPPDVFRWLEAGQHVQLVEAPLDIARAVQQHLLSRPDDESSARTVVLTSATLGSDPSLQRFKTACGLESARTLSVPSPFDYAQQAALYIPPDLVAPEHAGHSNQLADLVAHSARVLGGSTLVLTTTTRALDMIGRRLRAALRLPGDPEVLIQGEQTRSVLLERFRSGADGGTGQGGFVLVASASFWEGVDVPGPALRLLVIDKLPFPPPDDPWVAAHTRQLESIGKSPFAHFALPAAALALRQGAGRLIRRETDRGLLVIGDVRLRSKGYRKRLLAALPPLRHLESPSDYSAALEALTRFSTTDPNWP